jgi:hypothetical protein
LAAPNFAEFHTVSIDFEVFKALTARLESPNDSYNEVLRRLLQLPPVPSADKAVALTDARSWVVGGASFPQGTEFRARYRGQTYTARVEDGALVYNGQRFESPSPAAAAITRNSVNGWLFWECRLPGRTQWVSMKSLRSR